jgi:hypothetical protein
MDTPIEEQQVFQNVTCNIAASEHEITEPNTLSIDFLSYVSPVAAETAFILQLLLLSFPTEPGIFIT